MLILTRFIAILIDFIGQENLFPYSLHAKKTYSHHTNRSNRYLILYSLLNYTSIHTCTKPKPIDGSIKVPPNFIYTINHLTMHRQQVLPQSLQIFGK